MSDPIILIKLGSSLYNSTKINNVLLNLEKRINNLYDNIIGTHIKSACDTIKTIQTSNNPNCELSNALNDIRNAIYMLKYKIEEKEPVFLFIGERYVMSNEERRDSYMKLSQLYYIKCILFRLSNSSLNEVRNIQNEHNKVLSMYVDLAVKIIVNKGYDEVGEPIEKFDYDTHDRYFVAKTTHYNYSTESIAQIRKTHNNEAKCLENNLAQDLKTIDDSVNS